jgi:hypothetical protein
LDPSDPGYYYSLYALYKRKSMHLEQRKVLLDALEIDPNNPIGRFEFAYILRRKNTGPILFGNIGWLRASPRTWKVRCTET